MKQLKFLDISNQNSIITIELPGNVQAVSLLSVLFLSSIILVAAFGKLFSPSDDFPALDIFVSFFEMVLIGSLILFRNRLEIWFIASLVFASWGGYSLFWYLAELPCSCMGESIYVPHGFSLVMDALFFSLSLCVAYLLGACKKSIALVMVNSVIFSAGGYALGKWIFEYILLD